MEQFKEIAQRLVCLREDCGYTREQLAEELGIPLEDYARYEEDGKDVPINVIFQIAGKFGVDFTEILTGTAAKLNTYHIVRSGEGRAVDRYPGYSYDDLAFRYSHKVMQPLLVTLDPSDEPAKPVQHPGQEFNYVVKGKIIVTFADKEFLLSEGDSIYFNPTFPHGQKCGCDTPSTFLTVIAE
ncbi:MAG: cupin domain-containing protein [Oscillospiraceae bacterium]|nr:cupin domain-containing protein [Oscillospiraceae bacterium]